MTTVRLKIPENSLNFYLSLFEKFNDIEILDLKNQKSETVYSPEFVEKILESKQQAKDGKTTRVEKENLKGFLGI
jgi:hypothetical protein